MELEFIDDVPADSDVEAGPTRSLPRTVGLLVVAAAVVCIVAFVAARQPQDARRPLATVSAPATPRPTPHALSAQDQNLDVIFQRATGAPEPAVAIGDGSESGGCAAVRGGTSPQNTASAVLTAGLTGYTKLDATMVLDQHAGLCSLQIRARSNHGTIAVLLIVSPIRNGAESANPNVIQSAVSPRHRSVVEYVQFRTTDGWVVLVGTSGRHGDQPSTKALAVVAVDPRLRW